MVELGDRTEKENPGGGVNSNVREPDKLDPHGRY